MTKKLFRVWHFTQNDRSEFARILAHGFEAVQNFLMKQFIKPEFHSDIEQTEFGLQWADRTPEQCKKDMSKEDLKQSIKEYGQDFNPCEFCEGCVVGFQIEEIEQPEQDDFQLKTIYGTNDFYDITKTPHIKAEDWQPLLARAWKIDTQVGCNMLTSLTKIAIKVDGTVDLEKSKTVKKITKMAKPK